MDQPLAWAPGHLGLWDKCCWLCCHCGTPASPPVQGRWVLSCQLADNTAAPPGSSNTHCCSTSSQPQKHKHRARDSHFVTMSPQSNRNLTFYPFYFTAKRKQTSRCVISLQSFLHLYTHTFFLFFFSLLSHRNSKTSKAKIFVLFIWQSKQAERCRVKKETFLGGVGTTSTGCTEQRPEQNRLLWIQFPVIAAPCLM